MINIPEKEFEKIEIAGNFGQVSLYTVNSDVLIHANDSLVNLDLEADCLNHNITLDGLESDAFRKVSVYFDKFPDNVRMDLNLIQGGTINDPQNLLKEKGFESGSGKPVISINDTQEINIYSEEYLHSSVLKTFCEGYPEKYEYLHLHKKYGTALIKL